MTPADFKALGRAIRRWLRLHAKQQGSVRWYDTDGLRDLLKGQPVQSPLSENAAGSLAPAGGDFSPNASFAAGPSPENVALLDAAETTAPRPICLSLIYNKDCDHRYVMAAVRRAMPTELIADVLIEGRSWDNERQGEWIGVRRATS